MSAIHAVLLVPEEGDPLGLLATGVCGARPPRAWRHPRCGWLEQKTFSNYVGQPRALVLAWGGKAVAEGFDRAHRRAHGHLHGVPDDYLTVETVRQWAAANAASIGVIVILCTGDQVTP